jgi:hypothetical protein
MALTHSQNDLFYWRLLHITVPSKRLNPFRRHGLAPCVFLLFLLPVAFGTLGLKNG